MTPTKRGKFPKNIPYHDVFMGTLPSSRRGKCVTLFGGSQLISYGTIDALYCRTHKSRYQVPIAELAERWTELPQVSGSRCESRSFFRVHTGYFSNIPKCIKAEFIASWACSQSSVVSSSQR
ncbi:hypothetical protein TNCV_392131 [Trichonephila clavipes]|nr:hypothetical protein TNCV_392131 [Trichonephila clavipes]